MKSLYVKWGLGAKISYFILLLLIYILKVFTLHFNERTNSNRIIRRNNHLSKKSRETRCGYISKAACLPSIYESLDLFPSITKEIEVKCLMLLVKGEIYEFRYFGSFVFMKLLMIPT